MTRRQLMLVTPAALLVQAQAQTQQPAPPEPPKNPEEELQAALQSQHRNADTLAKVALPMAAEPAVHFKA